MALDAKGALVPHGIGEHARTLLSTAIKRLATAEAGIKWEADRNALLLAELESSEALDTAEMASPRPIRFADLPAQPQGEPVAWQYRIVEDGKPLFNPMKKDGWIDTVEGVAKDMAERPSLSKNRRYEVRKLYAEQPAPAGVLMTGRRPIPDGIESLAKQVYQSWESQPGFVPWVDGGNSHKQNEARAMASRTFELALANQAGD